MLQFENLMDGEIIRCLLSEVVTAGATGVERMLHHRVRFLDRFQPMTSMSLLAA